ncbi:MAG: TrpB-like pyridoxal-phosphate dependent enzyme, partial [Candidatus Omnitrophota bacterium]
VPEPIHAGGLRYHGMAPLVSHAIREGLLQPRAYDQVKCYNSAFIWTKTEGTIPAPETSHAIACVIDEALKAKREGKKKVILFSYSGHGLMDLMGYEKFLSGKLSKYHLSERDLKASLEAIKKFPKIKVRGKV